MSLEQHSHYAYASFEQADLVKELVKHKQFVFPDGFDKGKAATGKELSDEDRTACCIPDDLLSIQIYFYHSQTRFWILIQACSQMQICCQEKSSRKYSESFELVEVIFLWFLRNSMGVLTSFTFYIL